MKNLIKYKEMFKVSEWLPEGLLSSLKGELY